MKRKISKLLATRYIYRNYRKSFRNKVRNQTYWNGQGVDQGEILFDTCGEMDYNTLNKRADD